ncbi:MAG TPA: alpha/beta fold hydrolase [Terriglobales bacterium]|nr:alpha/beta fold hydrolase [Terriglobales bacterium]
MLDSAQIEAPMPPEVSSAEDVSHLSGKIADRHGFVTSIDQTRLFYRHWHSTAWNGRIAVVLHGIGYHSAPYKVIADALNPQGTDVYALDARGHGLSQGRRGYVGTSIEVGADVESMIRFVHQQRPAAKIFLLGDSMGAGLALNYAKRNSRELSGLILLALALNLDASQFVSLESLSLMPYFVLAHREPVISLVGKRLEESSRDAEFIARRRVDPLAYKNVSFGYLLDVQRIVFGWRWRIAPRVHSPTLLIKGGEDRVVSHRECVAFDRLCASPDKSFKIYPNVPHTTLWDPETPEILDHIGKWILEH